MDTSFVPLILVAFVVGMAGTWMELRAAVEPPTCGECPHCRDRVAERRQERLAAERRQAEAHSLYNRRWRTDDEEERRGRD
jgi:hypothetical protein